MKPSAKLSSVSTNVSTNINDFVCFMNLMALGRFFSRSVRENIRDTFILPSRSKFSKTEWIEFKVWEREVRSCLVALTTMVLMFK